MIDWTKYALLLVLIVLGGIVGAVLGFTLFQLGVVYNLPVAVAVFMSCGVIGGVAFGARFLKDLPPLSLSTKTGIRFAIGILFIINAIVDAFPYLVGGRVSWKVVSPATGAIVGIAFLIPITRFVPKKFTWNIVATVAGLIVACLIFARDYETKDFVDLAAMLAIFLIVFIWSLFRKRANRHVASN
jgi:uncharacterized membrane protein